VPSEISAGSASETQVNSTDGYPTRKNYKRDWCNNDLWRKLIPRTSRVPWLSPSPHSRTYTYREQLKTSRTRLKSRQSCYIHVTDWPWIESAQGAGRRDFGGGDCDLQIPTWSRALGARAGTARHETRLLCTLSVVLFSAPRILLRQHTPAPQALSGQDVRTVGWLAPGLLRWRSDHGHSR